MGAYLSEPNTEKYSSDDALTHLKYGASSMQGWRTSQEDSHNCILNFDTGTSLFAVYDGHGGAEVAQYCSIHLPDYIKSHATYASGNMAQALEDAFLGFDATLVQDETIAELKQLASLEDQPSDADENEVNHLFAEANMPLDALLAKYKKDAPVDRQLTGVQETDDEKPLSPFLRAKQHSEAGGGGNNMIREAIARAKRGEGDLKEDGDTSTKTAATPVVNGDASSGDAKTKADTPATESKTPVKGAEPSGVAVTPSRSSSSSAATSRPGPSGGGGGSSSGGSGFAIKRAGGISAALAAATAESSSEEEPEEQEESSEEDRTYVTRKQRRKQADSDDDSDDDDDDDAEGDSTADGAAADSDDSKNDSEEEEEDDDDDEDEKNMSIATGNEVPGADSGCTAVVALLRKNVLYVANAGDSRCIVSRKGKAIDMSVDHKPEDELELKRIQKAGGKVTSDGRVNGGLNLSRALGDHTYKKNEEVSAKEQMISALPDIRTLTIDPAEDEFMVLACDGIWNYMSSQEVADFVRERLNADGSKKLSSICEELFDVCLAPSTHGDGTGCDNMTAIIVVFEKGLVDGVVSGKRSLENDATSDSSASKRQKSHNGESDNDTTTAAT